jgi:hypothetical protein
VDFPSARRIRQKQRAEITASNLAMARSEPIIDNFVAQRTKSMERLPYQ